MHTLKPISDHLVKITAGSRIYFIRMQHSLKPESTTEEVRPANKLGLGDLTTYANVPQNRG
jgi:hypothetical protein